MSSVVVMELKLIDVV